MGKSLIIKGADFSINSIEKNEVDNSTRKEFVATKIVKGYNAYLNSSSMVDFGSYNTRAVLCSKDETTKPLLVKGLQVGFWFEVPQNVRNVRITHIAPSYISLGVSVLASRVGGYENVSAISGNEGDYSFGSVLNGRYFILTITTNPNTDISSLPEEEFGAKVIFEY